MTADAKAVARMDFIPDARASAPTAPRLVERHRDWAVGLAVAVACSMVAWGRMTPVTRSTIWAEDGRVFLMDAFSGGPIATLLRPYDGYLHLVPRATAGLIATLVPPQRYALAFSAVACVIVGGAAALTYVCASAVTSSRVLRLCLAAVTVAVPALPLEVLGNIANIHWFFLWLTPWLLLYTPRTRAGSWGLGLLALVGALTEIQMLFFAPLVLWRLRDRRGWPIRIGMFVGLTSQGVAVLTSNRAPMAGAPPSIADLVAGYMINAVMTLWQGSTASISALVSDYGWWIPALSLLPSLAALVLVWLRGNATQRLAALVLPAASVVVWSGGLIVNGPGYKYARPVNRDVEFEILRYAVVPSMFVLAALLLALATFDWSRRRSGWVAFAAALPLGLAVVGNSVPAHSGRSEGPVWLQEFERARDTCVADTSKRTDLLGVAPPGWAAEVPCEVLER